MPVYRIHVYKQPDETFPIAVDFKNVLADGESIDSGASTVKAYDAATGVDVSNSFLVSGSMTVDGTKLVVKITDGSENNVYKVTFKAVTNLSNTFEQDIFVAVKEV